MTVQELMKRLEAFHPSMQVMVLEGFNGGGILRDINSGPKLRTIDQIDANETADCEDRVGENVVAIGYGSY